MTLTNSTVSGNTANDGFGVGKGGGGGGIANDGTMTLTNSTVSGNTAAGSAGARGGGGIANDSGTLTLINSNVNGNTADSFRGGGGINNDGTGTVTLTNSTVSGNMANYGVGGGIANTVGTTLTLTNSTVSDNSASEGGGINNGGTSTVTLTNSTVSDNSGGGIGNGGTVTLTNSTVSGNTSSGFGGGIKSSYSNGTVTLTNSTVSGNTASDGGGIFNVGMLKLTDSTVSGNTASDGGGFSGGGIFNFVGTVTLRTTILAGNRAPFGPDCSGPLTSEDYNLVGNTTGCTIGGAATHDITGQNPALGPLGDNGGPTPTLLPQAGSPAIDAAPLSACAPLTTDQRGLPRPDAAEATCDIGAVEVQHPIDTTPPSCQFTAVLAGPPEQLQITVQDADGGLTSVVTTTSRNATVTIPAFTPGSTSALVVTAAKIDQTKSAQVALRVADVAGNVTTCDQVLTDVIRGSGTANYSVAAVGPSEGKVHIYNGNPGVAWITLWVNWRPFVMYLAPNQQRTLDISSALKAGANLIVLVARGQRMGDAAVVFANQ